MRQKYINIFFFPAAFIACAFLTTAFCTPKKCIELNESLVNTIIGSTTSVYFNGLDPAASLHLCAVSEKEFEQSSAKPKTTAKSAEVIAASHSVAKTSSVPAESLSISNATSLVINKREYIEKVPAFLHEKPSVLIVHTHTTESYTPSKAFDYTPTDTDRTTDKKYNMCRVGQQIKSELEKSGIKVIHDTAINDYPSYSGSYNKSGKTVANYIKNDPSIKIVLDVHRDAIEGTNGEKIKHTVTIDGKTAATVMLVAGTDQSGLAHNNWQTNLSFALLLEKHCEETYPGLCKTINLRKQRFNQQLAPGALIVEVGTNGNTLDEALLGAEYFTKALAGFLKYYSA